jgi:hypothetical protein
MDRFLLSDLVDRLVGLWNLKAILRKTEPKWHEAHLLTVSAELELLCRKMGLKTFCHRAGSVRESLELERRLREKKTPQDNNWKYTHSDAVQELTAFGEDLTEHLSKMFAVPIATEHNCFLTQEDDRVVKSFPTAAGYLSDSSACVAVRLWQGSVYYSMLALEVFLTSLANRFKVEVQHQQWNTVISQIEARIRDLGPESGATWRDQRERYSDLALEFRFLKDAWRNRCMHLREVHTENSAIRILEHCRAIGLHLTGVGLQESPTTRAAIQAQT